MHAKEWGLVRTAHGSTMNPLTPTPKMNESEENAGFSTPFHVYVTHYR